MNETEVQPVEDALPLTRSAIGKLIDERLGVVPSRPAIPTDQDKAQAWLQDEMEREAEIESGIRQAAVFRASQMLAWQRSHFAVR